MDNTENRTGAHQRLRQRLEPAEYSHHFSTERETQADLFDQARCRVPIVRKQRVLHRFVDETVLLEPGTGTAVEVGHKLGRHTAYEALAQNLRKQMMIAIPAPLVVQRHEKQIGVLKLGQDELAIRLGVRDWGLGDGR